MINFLVQNRISVVDSLEEKENKNKYSLRTVIPFCSTRKKMVVAYKISEETVRVVVKGAPEEIMLICTQQLNSSH
jgi:magnesium-transporting ATPase (P-type)